MAARAKRGRAAKATTQEKRVRIEYEGSPPTAAQRKQIQEILGLVELGVLALSQGVRLSRQCQQKQRRRR